MMTPWSAPWPRPFWEICPIRLNSSRSWSRLIIRRSPPPSYTRSEVQQANVGGMALSALALTMEQAGKAADLEAVRERLPELENRFVQLKAAMKERLFETTNR